MIKLFRHKGLQAFYSTGNKAGILPHHEKRLRLLLVRLAASTKPDDMDLPGVRLHQLAGKLQGFWSVDVSGNWRLIFRFDGSDAIDVDYLDYH